MKKAETQLVEVDELTLFIALCFFGGWFEISRGGPVTGRIYSGDISSAYPYEQANLPCLKCGSWERVQGGGIHAAVERARLAAVEVTLKKCRGMPTSWGPFPFRDRDGSILHPLTCGRTACWRPEYLAAVKTFPQIKPLVAWVYHTDCDHRPFAFVPDLYRERLRIGKEGPGIVLKLGPNSIYGATSETSGGRPGKFQNFVWAGNTTSGARAQVLEVFARNDLSTIIQVATDAVFATAPLRFPTPRDTGTHDCVNEKGEPANKPLGGWESNEYAGGLFLCRPGIYFPLAPEERTAKGKLVVKARGVSKSVLHDHCNLIQEHWAKYGASKPYVVGTLPGRAEYKRFVGWKVGVQFDRRGRPKRSERYGDWLPHVSQIDFTPHPKRVACLPDGHLTAIAHVAGESMAYGPALGFEKVLSPEMQAILRVKEMIADQPDGSFAGLVVKVDG